MVLKCYSLEFQLSDGFRFVSSSIVEVSQFYCECFYISRLDKERGAEDQWEALISLHLTNRRQEHQVMRTRGYEQKIT